MEGTLHARQGSTVVAETALGRHVVSSHIVHLPLSHLRGQHGSQDIGWDDNHVGALVWCTRGGAHLSDQLKSSGVMKKRQESRRCLPFMLASSASARLTDA